MKPEEKVIELIQKFRIYVGSSINDEGATVNNYLIGKKAAKACAIICIDEIINQASVNIYTVGNNNLSNEEFWQQVKEEIKKL